MDYKDLFANGTVPTQNTYDADHARLEALSRDYAKLGEQKEDIVAKQDDIKEEMMAILQRQGMKSEKTACCSLSISKAGEKKSIPYADVEKNAPQILLSLEQLGLVKTTLTKENLSVKINKPDKVLPDPANAPTVVGTAPAKPGAKKTQVKTPKKVQGLDNPTTSL